MEEIRRYLEDLLTERLYQIIVSNPKYKEGAFKIKVRPVMVKGSLEFQQTVYKGTQVFHGNYPKEEIIEELLGLLGFANMWLAVFADSGVAMLCVLNAIRILYIFDK